MKLNDNYKTFNLIGPQDIRHWVSCFYCQEVKGHGCDEKKLLWRVLHTVDHEKKQDGVLVPVFSIRDYVSPCRVD